MWCIPSITPEFKERMEDILALYAKPYNPQEPVLCLDEKSKQLLKDTRPRIPCKEGAPRKVDHEYARNGTRNIFMTVEPKGGYRSVRVTERRTKSDFAREVRRIVRLPRFRRARKIHIVVDNLNTHFESSFIETFGEKEARAILSRIIFHYTPKHASWLNMAEIELSVMDAQCTRKRIPDEEILTREIDAWQTRRNNAKETINWKFTVEDARKRFRYIGQN